MNYLFKGVFKTMGDIRYNKAIVKTINESLIRKVLQKEAVFTKTKIARETGLSFPTVSRILDEMAQSGEILIYGVDPTTGGRHAQSYVINPEFAYILCVFSTIRGLRSVITNSLGEKVNEEEHGMVLERGKFIEKLDEVVAKKTEEYPVRALSVGLNWGVSSNGTILFGAEPFGLQNFNLKEHLEEKFKLRVRVENDMNAIATGCYEKKFDQDDLSLACVSIGRTGCGCGLYLRGHLVRGVHGFAGELRYLPIDENRNLDKEFAEGFPTVPETSRIAQLVSSLCCTVDPGVIVFYDRGGQEQTLRQVEEDCRKYLPEEVIPKLEILNTYEEDYEAGLVSFGKDLLLTGYEIVNR